MLVYDKQMILLKTPALVSVKPLVKASRTYGKSDVNAQERSSQNKEPAKEGEETARSFLSANVG
jgi:hypothetical protein